MPIMVDFHCHGLSLNVRYRDGREETKVGQEDELKVYFEGLKSDDVLAAQLTPCGFQLPDKFRGEKHVCPKCGEKMREFGFKNNGQNWKWNDMGFDNMKHHA